MENKNHHHNSGNGFLFGVIVGVIITLLFTTKKGREILKDLTEKGLDKFADLQKTLDEKKDEFKEALDEENLEEDSDYVEPQEVRYLAQEPSSSAVKEEAPVARSSDSPKVVADESSEPKKVEHVQHVTTHANSPAETNGEARHSVAKRFFLRKPAKKS